MKLKYKRMILWITMGAMCVGFITLSLNDRAHNSSTKEEKNKNQTHAEATSKTTSEEEGETPSEAPGGESEPSKEAEQKIEELVNAYYEASVHTDMEALKELVSNIKHIDKDALSAKNEYIEEYRNIKCYVMEGPKEGTYCVYVRSDLKILNIDTLAPGLIFLYVTTSQDGKLQVYLDTLDQTTQAYLQKMHESKEVMVLSGKVNQLLDAAVTKDKDLKAFYEKLAGEGETTKKEDTKKEDTKTKTETKTEQTR